MCQIFSGVFWKSPEKNLEIWKSPEFFLLSGYKMPPKKFPAFARPGLARLIRRRLLRKRKAGVMRSQLSVPTVHAFKRTQYIPAYLIVPSGSSWTFGALAFNFDAMPNFTDFTSLFDQYKIRNMKVTLIPRYSETPIATGVGTSLGSSVITVLDRDDDTAPTSINDLCQYTNMRQTKGGKNHMRSWRPTVKVPVLGLSGTDYSVKSAPWIDAASTDVKHYGLKYAIEQGSGAVVYDIKVEFNFLCKNTK